MLAIQTWPQPRCSNYNKGIQHKALRAHKAAKFQPHHICTALGTKKAEDIIKGQYVPNDVWHVTRSSKKLCTEECQRTQYHISKIRLSNGKAFGATESAYSQVGYNYAHVRSRARRLGMRFEHGYASGFQDGKWEKSSWPFFERGIS